MHIGILGGSFNPAHKGHYYISKQALIKLGLDQVWWAITPHNPFKDKNDLISLDKRVKQASNIVNYHKIKILVCEQSGQVNYSYILINHLLHKYPEHKFYWLIGADNLLNFHFWHKWDWIANNINIVVFPRNNSFPRALYSKFAIKYKDYLYRNANYAHIKSLSAPFWTFLNIKEIDISATEIRKKSSLSSDKK